MPVSATFTEFLKDILAEFGPVSVRKMFGGAGVYFDGVMFGLVADETLYLKTDEEGAAEFRREGMGPFVYEAEGRRPVTMSYWEVPSRLLDDPAELAPWAARAHAIARREKSKRRK